MIVDVPALVRAARGLFRRLGADRRGNVLMITGMALVPLTFATGMGIDYSRAMRLQTKLNAVSDAAALSTVTQPMMNQTMLSACGLARRNFVTQAAGLDGLTLNSTDPAGLTIVVTDTFATGTPVTLTCPALGVSIPVPATGPLTRVTTVTYRGQSTNAFVGVLGVASLTVKGNTTARAQLAPYVDIHLALDTSQSMGLPSTELGAQQLWTLTGRYNGRNCQFGCHVPGYVNGRPENFSNEAIANYFNIPLRVDVETNAASDMITTAQVNQGTKSLYRFGVYEFGTTLRDVKPLTTDLSSVQTVVNNLTLGPNDGTIGYGDTNLTDVFNSMKSRIPIHGDGTTQDKARAFMFIVTDGVQDLCGGGHCMALLDPTMCDYYKTNNITVGVVYTTYLPVRANPYDQNSSLIFEYTWLISPLPPTQIAPRLQSCASPGWYFEAADATGIHTAMQKLFSQATQTATITH